MVASRHPINNLLRAVPLALALLVSVAVSAQVFPVSDTVTEYRHKGTFYHDKFEGRKTASGEVFDQNGFTAAHWKIKLGTYAMVTNENTGLQVIVKINDRCPKHGVLDLSHRAATAIGIKGCQPVSVRLLPEGYEERCLAQDVRFDSVYSRLNPAPKTEAKEPVVEEEKTKPAAQPKKAVDAHQHEEGCQRIILGTVQSHADAYSMIRMLPDVYQERASVETLEEGGALMVYLDLNLRHSKAEELCRALKRNFPNVRLANCE
jgi:rare lipoprotein A